MVCCSTNHNSARMENHPWRVCINTATLSNFSSVFQRSSVSTRRSWLRTDIWGTLISAVQTWLHHPHSHRSVLISPSLSLSISPFATWIDMSCMCLAPKQRWVKLTLCFVSYFLPFPRHYGRPINIFMFLKIFQAGASIQNARKSFRKIKKSVLF